MRHDTKRGEPTRGKAKRAEEELPTQADAPRRRSLLLGLGAAALAAACGGEVGGAAGAGGGSAGAGGSGGGSGGAGGSAGGNGGGAPGGEGGGGGGPTPSCDETPDDIEGPYYTPGAPELTPDAAGRAVLSPDEPGERIVLAGTVRGLAGCAPLADAELDLWHADVDGAYDLAGFVFRGRVRTSAGGAFAIETVLPGRYLNGATYRPRHLHLKVRAEGYPELTTQLYFPDDPFNDTDAFFDPRLLITDEVVEGERFARFDFVLGGG